MNDSTAASVEGTTFADALADLVETMRVDALPPPINIGWGEEGLTVQVDVADAHRWVQALDGRGTYIPVGHVVYVGGRLLGTRTHVRVMYALTHPVRAS